MKKNLNEKKSQFIFSCDGTIKTIEKPLESDDAVVLLQHENEIEAVVTDENNTFYCGMCHCQRERERKSLFHLLSTSSLNCIKISIENHFYFIFKIILIF